ncbi:hypothetical protein BV210_05785 [Halorientalis sp. IM1011]|uniref:ABC transporter permease n=1 Tax=Halorientalis sp. IM1011 TaxID=1932360 RepID=UPI00097CC69E|nr:ABC transporter permease [Halorientalis sp. IM1011]AQL42252.1 hypothetical protein BV210_05785 [Halorientalis sp. IM1011]
MPRSLARLRRWYGLVGLGVTRVVGSLVHGGTRRVGYSVLGVAIAVALLTVVTGIAFGVTADATVHGEGVDYVVVPERGTASSAVVATGDPRLGDVHATAAGLREDERISHATPVLRQVLQVSVDGGSTQEYVAVVGVVGGENLDLVAGVNVSALTPGDPHYANGSRNGSWTGEVVLNEAAASVLNASAGSGLQFATAPERNFSVVAVADAERSGPGGSVPVAAAQLSELQAVTGADRGDVATHLLVDTNAPGVRDRLAGLYPNTEVVEQRGLSTYQLGNSDLPLAMAVVAFLTALVVGVLFIGTTMALAVTADRRLLATMGAVGFGGRSRSLIVLAETVTVSVLGGILGVVVGRAGIAATNLATREYLGTQIAQFHLALAAYGLGVAVVIGLLAAPYPVWLSHRGRVTEDIRR